MNETSEPVDNLGGVLSALMVGGLILAINFAPVPNETKVVVGLGAVAVVAGIAFFIRQKRVEVPLYDLDIASRRIFWVAACAGIIVFGSLMGAMFVGQQYLQNVLGYSSLEAGLAIIPAALFMVAIAPRSAKLVEANGARVTLLMGYVFCFLGFLTMLLLWSDHSPYWHIGLGYAFIGAGVGFAGTPASHSLTGSVPVSRAGMASGTADLQRDLGGAIMQSIMGALLTAGYASAVATAIAGSPDQKLVTDNTQAELQKSFASASATAERYPGTPNRSSPRRRSRSSTARSGRTPRASSPSCSALLSCGSCSRSTTTSSCSSLATGPRTKRPHPSRALPRRQRAARRSAARRRPPRRPSRCGPCRGRR